jgi:hypothetical protein
VIGFPAAPRQIDRTASLAALILVATVTEAMFLLLPSVVGALGTSYICWRPARAYWLRPTWPESL